MKSGGGEGVAASDVATTSQSAAKDGTTHQSVIKGDVWSFGARRGCWLTNPITDEIIEPHTILSHRLRNDL